MSYKDSVKKRFNVNKIVTRLFYCFGIAVSVATLGAIGYHLSTSLHGANATNIGMVGGDKTRELDQYREAYHNNDAFSMMFNDGPLHHFFTDEELEATYNSHDYYHTYTRTKNQQTEGLCWSYGTTTAMEYALEKDYEATSISPKHIDYMFVKAEDAYDDADVYNPYNDLAASAGMYQRSLGDGGYAIYTIGAALSPYGLTKEDSFLSVLKNKDNRINSVAHYEDIWDLPNVDEILVKNSSDYNTYTVKQDYDEVNKTSDAGYVVTGSKNIFDYKYGDSAEKRAVVTNIKNAIKNYGAAAISTYFDMDGCGTYYLDGDTGVFVVIDRGYNVLNRPVCNTSTGHVMALIGWDDNFTYTDPKDNTTKQGAFIIQNSWGEQISGHEAKYYMSYDSAFDVYYFDGFDKLDAYDHYYSLKDYVSSSYTANNKEYAFKFTASENEVIKKITFMQSFDDVEQIDVYISTTGNDADYVKDGTFTAYAGVTSYTPTRNYEVSSNFAIKLVNLDTSEESAEVVRYKTYDMVNVFTDKKSNTDPQEYTYTLTAKLGQGAGDDIVRTCTSTSATEACSVTIPQAQREGFQLVGYANSATSPIADYQAGASYTFTPGTFSVTIYAVWQQSVSDEYTYTLTAKLGQGAGDDIVRTCTSTSATEACSVTIPQAQREGYMLTGYSTTADSSTVWYRPDTEYEFIPGQFEVTIYAVWYKVEPVTYVLNFDLGGGAGVQPVSCEAMSASESCTVTIPSTIPTKEGYKFFWYATAPNLTTEGYRPGSEYRFIIGVQNQTLYAVWGNGAVTWVNGREHHIDVSGDAIIKVDYPLSTFVSVSVDGQELEKKDYSARNGSTVVTIKGAYLDNLNIGSHDISLTFANNEVIKTTLTVIEEDIDVPDTHSDGGGGNVPDTGFNTNTGDGDSSAVFYVIPISLVVILTASFTAYKFNKRRIAFKNW